MTSQGNDKNGSESKKLHFTSQKKFVRICVTKSVCHGEMGKKKIEGPVRQEKLREVFNKVSGAR